MKNCSMAHLGERWLLRCKSVITRRDPGMRINTIPYQLETDLVYSGTETSTRRPALPASSVSHVGSDGNTFVKPEEIPLNKRNFIYTPCTANPLFRELKYSTTEYPHDSPGINAMDRSDGLSLGEHSTATVSVPDSSGWRTGRCDISVKEGDAYWEVEIQSGGSLESSSLSLKSQKEKLNVTPHVRVGISRREASLEAPVGFDPYGYGVRDNTLESIHQGKITQRLPGTRLKSGDRLGLLLHLPSYKEQLRQSKEYTRCKLDALSQSGINDGGSTADFNGPSRKRSKLMNTTEFQRALLRDHDPTNIIRDHIAIRYKNQLFFEATDYVKTTKPEYYTSDKRERQDYYSLDGSYLRVYLNGEPIGDAFNDLRPFLPPFSELQYNEKFYFGYWKSGSDHAENGANGSDSLPLSTGNKRKGQLLKNKYVNNNKLGYYPTISCFNGGVARIVTNTKQLLYWDKVKQDKRDVKCLDEIYDEQVADEIVWDIIDEVEAEFLCGSL